jgi:hypothetical protein
MDRHDRQVRLAGVGEAGQARVARVRVDVGLDGLAADVAARYLAGAGVACVRVRETSLCDGARAIDGGVRVEVAPALADAPEANAPVDVADPVAREAARGALLALRVLRAALAAQEEPS